METLETGSAAEPEAQDASPIPKAQAPHVPAASSEPLITAHGLGLKTYAGYAYKNVDLELHGGQVVAVCGEHGCGKTALLLTLAGRMKFSEGSLRVSSYDLPHKRGKAAATVGMSLFEGLNDLQDSLTVGYAMAAEYELYGRKPQREAIAADLRYWGIEYTGETRVKDLTATELTLLGIALAFVKNPRIVVVDDIEIELRVGQSADIMQRLIDTARARNVGVVVGLVERDLAKMADTCIYLAKEGR